MKTMTPDQIIEAMAPESFKDLELLRAFRHALSTAAQKLWPHTNVGGRFIESQARAAMECAKNVFAEYERELEELRAENKALWHCMTQISKNAPRADITCYDPGISLLEAVKQEVAQITKHTKESDHE